MTAKDKRRASTVLRHNQIWEAYEEFKREVGAPFVGLSKNYICEKISQRLLLHPKTIQQILSKTSYTPIKDKTK